MPLPYAARNLLPFALALLSGAAAAQTPLEERVADMQRGYEARIAALESEVRTLRSTTEARAADDRAAAVEREAEACVHSVLTRGGVRHALETARFDARLNPTFNVVGDFVATASDKRDGFDDQNVFRTRGAEVGVFGRVPDFGAYVATLHFLPDEVEFEEGYVVVDKGLPGGFLLKAGSFFRDFGKVGALHDHELPFVDQPAVYQEYFGGSPVGLGIEAHHEFSIGHTPLRWSVGVANDLDGHTVAMVGPAVGAEEGDDSAPGFGRRGFENFSFHARATTIFDLGASSSLQLGASALFSPESVAFTDDGAGGVLRDETRASILGADVSYRWKDADRDDAFALGVEILRSRRDRLVIDDSSTPFTSTVTPAFTAWGGYAYAEYSFDARWSAGGFLDLLDRADAPGFNWIGFGAFVTWRANEANRLRLQAQIVDDRLADDRYFAVMLQWTVLIGSHAHLANW